MTAHLNPPLLFISKTHDMSCHEILERRQLFAMSCWEVRYWLYALRATIEKKLQKQLLPIRPDLL